MENENLKKNVQKYLLLEFIEILEELKNLYEDEDIKAKIEKQKANLLKQLEDLNEDNLLDIIDITVDEKIEPYSKIYTKNKEYINIEEEIKKLKDKVKNSNSAIIIEELEDKIYEKCNFDFKWAYIIGLLDGINFIKFR